MPERIQLRRTKGYRKPEGAIYVGRPSRYGNPFRIGQDGAVVGHVAINHTLDAGDCVWAYKHALHWGLLPGVTMDHVALLRGHELACWCPLDQPCHADVLLELANAELVDVR